MNPNTIHSELDEIAIPGVQPSPEAQDGGGALNPEAIHSDLDETMTLQLQAGQELQTGRGKSLQAGWQTIVPDIDDIPATAVLPEVEEYRPKGLLDRKAFGLNLSLAALRFIAPSPLCTIHEKETSSIPK